MAGCGKSSAVHITCEKCSTTYVLDDALIPPQGVPVQCTRCAHVFTAKAPSAAVPAPAPQQPGNSTMMFGAPAAAPAPAKNQTMMFGGPTMSSPTPAPAPAKNQTMMFGVPGAPAEPAKNQTMMFGTPASNAAPPPPAAQPPAVGRSTMMFGAPAPAPAPAKNQTMMFGTPASNAAAAAASTPDSAAATTSKTLVFGGAPPAAPAKNQTMLFGTAAANAAAQAAQSAQAPVAPGSKTQLYGDDSAEETIMEHGPGQSSRTLIFGGAMERPSEPEPSKNQTMMFGRSPIPKVTAGTVELAGIAADESAPNESTVRVDESQVKSEQDDGSNTDTGGEPQPPPRQERTQRFAMSDIARPPERPRSPPTLEPVAPSVEVESVDLSATQTLRPGQLDPSALGFDPHRTLPPDLQVTPPNPVAAIARPDVVTPPAPFGATEPDLQKLETTPGYRLQLENPDTAPGLLGAPLDLQSAQDDAAMMRAVKKGGSGRTIVIVLLLIALALSGLLVWRLFGKQLMGEQASAQALKQTGDAFALLRRDDALNQAKAVEELRSVLAQNPALVEAQAALVMGLAAQFDDAQAELGSGEAHMARVKAAGVTQAELDALQTVLTAQTEVVQRTRKQLDEAHARLMELGANVERGSPTESAVVRADGFARGVKGDAEAISRAVQFAQLNPNGADAWVGLIEPEYALNGGTQLDEAVKQLQTMHDDAFFRPAVLLARLELKRGNADVAAEQLERVVQLNDQHALAKALLKAIAK